MRWVSVDGRQIAYRSAGSGPPLVLLHGGLVDSRAWRRELEAFADDFHVVAWDAPGCGESADPAPNATVGDYVNGLAWSVEPRRLDFGERAATAVLSGGRGGRHGVFWRHGLSAAALVASRQLVHNRRSGRRRAVRRLDRSAGCTGHRAATAGSPVRPAGIEALHVRLGCGGDPQVTREVRDVAIAAEPAARVEDVQEPCLGLHSERPLGRARPGRRRRPRLRLR